MRVTFLSAALDMSGGSRVIHTYATLLQARGHEVRVVGVPEAQPSLRTRLRRLLRGEGGPARAARLSHYDRATYPVHVLDTARPIRGDDVPDADVVVATWWETVEWMLDFPPAKGRKVHFVQHYEAFTPDHKPRVNAGLRADTYKITISRWLDDMLRESFGSPGTALVPNGIDLDLFKAPPRGKQARPTVGFVYSSVGWKGAPTGFAAIEMLRTRFPDLRFLAFGSVPVLPHHVLPAGAEYTLLPAQESIPGIYASCDAWLGPSLSEGFGLPLLEAMACGCPVVSTRVGGPSDFVEDGVNGYLVDAGDAAAMADRLGRVLGLSEDDWSRMSDAARATAARYRWDVAADRFEAALLEAAASRPG